VVGKFARDEGYGEGYRFAVGRPAAIAVKLAGLRSLLAVVHRAVAAKKQRLVPGRADIAGVGGEAHPQSQRGIGGTQAAEDIAHLLFCMQSGFIKADERIAWAQVLPHILVGLHVSEADGGSGGKAPGPFRGTYEDSAQGPVEAAGFVDDVGHLDEGGAKDDGAQVGVQEFLHRIHQHGFGFEGAGGAAEEQDVGLGIERGLLRGGGGHPGVAGLMGHGEVLAL